MEGPLLSPPPPPPNHVLSLPFPVSKVQVVPKMMGRVPRWLGVVSTVLLAVPKPPWVVPRLFREVRRWLWLGVMPKVFMRAVLVVERNARIAADSAQLLSAMPSLFGSCAQMAWESAHSVAGSARLRGGSAWLLDGSASLARGNAKIAVDSTELLSAVPKLFEGNA